MMSHFWLVAQPTRCTGQAASPAAGERAVRSALIGGLSNNNYGTQDSRVDKSGRMSPTRILRACDLAAN